MTTLSLFTMILAALGGTPGESTGWGSGDVVFRAYVRTAEHQEVYPICAGQYTAEVVIEHVVDDPGDVLEYVTRVDICYDTKMNLTWGTSVEVVGTFHDGACPFTFCGRVEASRVERVNEWVEPEPPEEPNDIDSPSITTDSAEVTGLTVTMTGTVENDGGALTRCRFVYREEDGTSWNTEWVEDLSSGTSFSQQVAGLAPGKRYYYTAEGENIVGWGNGRQGMFTTAVETVPPIPHPAVWIAGPSQLDATSIMMVTDIERDIAAPEEYAFDFVSSPTGGAGGSDSIWQYSPMYTDVGLNPNHQYGYRIKARDSHGNETAYSPVRYEYTDIETPEGITFGQITTTSIQAKAAGTLSGLARGRSGLKLENTTAGQVSAWQRDNAFWTSDGLLANTRYSFRAQARNGDGDTTPLSQEASVYTLAIIPTTVTFASVTTSQLTACWSSNGNPPGTQYWCENTVSGKNSGWTTSTQWLDTSLSANVKYNYRVKARNGDGVETDFSAVTSIYSAIEMPTGIVLGTLAANSIQVKSGNTPSGLDQGESGLWFENITTGQTSGWRRDNAFWTTDGLKPNQSYSLWVRARNGDAVQTPFCQAVTVFTRANAPGTGAFSGVTAASIQVQWGANGNPAGTLYFCENTTAGMNSGWTTDTTWNNTGLAPNTAYAYRIKARNGDGVETAWTSLGSQSTEFRSVTINVVGGGKVNSPGQGTYRYAPGATVSLVAAPSAGYHFLCWTGNAVDAGRVADPNAAQTTVLVDAHYTLTANFLRTRIYVDKRATGTRDGSTWKNAFTSLRDALASAQTGNQVCIAQGTYKPDAGTDVLAGDRLASFELRNGVALLGGYAGVAFSDPNKRDIAVYETVLSGDLKGDDRAVTESYDLYSDISRTDNSFHVVVGYDVDTASLDGLTIAAGNGIDGAGLCLIRSHPTVSQCVIRGNRAGALSGDGLEGWGEGAGVSCYQSNPTFADCTFTKNWSGGLGGGVCSVESSPLWKGCTFRDNEAGVQGGAIYGEDSNSVCLNCTFHANWSGYGGALCAIEASHSRLTNCRFLGNGARELGGAIFDEGQSLDVANGLFSGNLASTDGGAMALTKGPATLTNCTFNRNVSEGKQSGQALAVRGAAATLTNCILWDTVDATQSQIVLTSVVGAATKLTASYCDVQGGEEAVLRKGTVTVTWGKGNQHGDPGFRNPTGPDGVAGTTDDDLHLRSGLGCANAGDNTAVPADIDDLNANGNRVERLPFDLDGKPRFVDRPDTPNWGVADPPSYPGIVDIGAYEQSLTGQ